jgi:hypothetical protein
MVQILQRLDKKILSALADRIFMGAAGFEPATSWV